MRIRNKILVLMTMCAACGSVGPDAIEDDIGTAEEALGVDPNCTEANIREAAPASAAVFLERAFTWVHNGVMYCECPTKNSGGYHADCSGFVSSVWSLSTPGNVTRQFPGGDANNGKAVEIRWDELTVGDALNWNKNSNTDPAGHAMLFGGWVDSSHVKFCTLEEYNTGHPASILTHSINDPASWWGGPKQPIKNVFHAIRKVGYNPSAGDEVEPPPDPQDNPPPPPSTSKYWVDTFGSAPGYSTPGGTRTGTLNAGTNYVFCKVSGPKVQFGSDYNTWWLKTDLDSGSTWQNQYVSAYYLSRWGNDIAKDNSGNTIPDC
jgi:hypothetical protein